MAKLTHHETFQPFSRGLIHHKKYLSDSAFSLFSYYLLKVKAIGEGKGKCRGFVIDWCEELGWPTKKWYKYIKELKPYIEIKMSGNRHTQVEISILRYKGMSDFYYAQNGNGKGEGKGTVKGTVEGKYGESKGKVTAIKTGKINDLQAPNKEISRKVEKNKHTEEWRLVFDVYKEQAEQARKDLLADTEWMRSRRSYHPNLDISKSLTKAWEDYWLTEAGWKNKKAKRSGIDWKRTANNALSQKMNQVWLKREEQNAPEIYTEEEAKAKGWL